MSLRLPGALRGDALRLPAQVAVAVGVSAVAGLAVTLVGDLGLALALFAAAVLVAAGMLRPAVLVSVFVLLRPLLDDFSGGELAGVPSANPGGALGLLLLGALAIVLAGAPRLFVPKATWAFVLVLAISAAAAVEAIVVVGPSMGFEPVSELLRLSALLAIYLLAANLFKRPEAMWRLFALVGVSAVVPAAFGIHEWVAGVEPPPGQDLGRISGTFTGPLPFSVYMAVAALVLIALPAERLRLWVRVPALAVILTALVGTYSREGWVLFLLGIVLLEGRRRKTLVIGTVLTTVVVALAVPSVQERVLPAESQSSQAGFESYDWRLDNWAGLLAKAAERPLFGWGLMTTHFVNPRAPAEGKGVPGGGYDAHHTAVRLLVEGGIVLLAAYVILFGLLIARLARLKKEQWHGAPFARILFWLWTITVVIAMSTDDPFEVTAVMCAMLALTGSVEGSHSHWIQELRRNS